MSKTLSAIPKKIGNDASHQRSERARAWLLTFNFPKGTRPGKLTPQDRINLEAFNRAAQVYPVTYCVFQGEQGESGTFHLQAYAEFAVPTTISSIKKHFGLHTLHCEVRLGTQEQAIAYCTKDDTRVSEIVSFGHPMKVSSSNPKGQGNRTDWDDTWKDLKNGSSIISILDRRPYMLNNIGALVKGQWEALRHCERVKKTQLMIFTGPPGCGKTTTAVNFAKSVGGVFLMPSDGKEMWWNGYDPLKHETVILDEFTGSKCPLTFLNQLCDSWPLRVGTKGGFMPFLARRIIITSNFLPETWYDFNNKDKNLCYDALKRRIDCHVNFRLIDILIEDAATKHSGFQKRLAIDNVIGEFHRSHVCSAYELEFPITPIYSEGEEPPLNKLKRRNASPIEIESSQDFFEDVSDKGKRRRMELHSDEELSPDVDEDIQSSSLEVICESNDDQ